MKAAYIQSQNPKSKTLWESYRNLNIKMNAPGITPERQAELRPLSTQLKTAAKIASLTEVQAKAVRDIQTQRDYTAKSGFRTTRSQTEILATLGGVDLAAVLGVVGSTGVTRG